MESKVITKVTEEPELSQVVPEKSEVIEESKCTPAQTKVLADKGSSISSESKLFLIQLPQSDFFGRGTYTQYSNLVLLVAMKRLY